LCEAIESGLTFRAAAMASGVPRRRRIAGGGATWMLHRQSDTRWHGRLIVPVVPLVLRGCWTPVFRNGSAKRDSAPDGDPGSSPAPRATHIQRSGRCCIVTAYRTGRKHLVTLPSDTSGRAPETSCTWILPATRALSASDTASREIAHSAAANGWSRARGSAMTSLTRSSMTRRPHSGIGNQPPISRVHNLRGQDN
jgi:hypothetical protein